MKTGKSCRSKEAAFQKLSAIDLVVHYLKGVGNSNSMFSVILCIQRHRRKMFIVWMAFIS